MREPIRLHLGGQQRFDGWTIVNIQPGPDVDIVADIADLSQFADDSVDEVYASHVFEHLSMGRVGPALLGVHRILKPGGIFRIAVPDLELLASMILDEHISTYGVWEVSRRIFGGDRDEHDRHCCGFTPDTMIAALEQCGFTDIRKVDSFGLFLDTSEVKFLGHRISLNMEATKPSGSAGDWKPRIPPVSKDPFDWKLVRDQIGNARMILEIGANQGTDTLAMMHHFPEATIHCFEPDPRAIAVHEVSINDPRVTLHRMAIAAFDGIADFNQSDGMHPDMPESERDYYPDGWDESGSLRKPTKHMDLYSWCKFREPIKVKTRSLDSLAREHGIGDVDFIWADMQGCEGDLILGGKDTIARTKAMFLEYSDIQLYHGAATLKQLMDMLPDWDIVYRSPTDVLLRNRKM